MRMTHAMSRFVIRRIIRIKGIIEATVATLASLAQFVVELWSFGPAKDMSRIKQIFFRRLEATTQSMEADAAKKRAEAELVRAAAAGIRGKRSAPLYENSVGRTPED